MIYRVQGGGLSSLRCVPIVTQRREELRLRNKFSHDHTLAFLAYTLGHSPHISKESDSPEYRNSFSKRSFQVATPWIALTQDFHTLH